MIVDPEKTHPVQMYYHLIGCIVPRPIAWVSTISETGVPNLAPFSYFTGVSVNPPTICFSPMRKRDGSAKDTLVNIEAIPEFVVNVVPASLAEAMNSTAAELDPGANEFEDAGLKPIPSIRVRPPSVADSPVRLECTLHQIVRVGEGPLSADLVIGRIVQMVIEDRVLDEDGRIDPVQLDLIGRMGGDTYTRTRDRFEIKRTDR